MAMTNADLHQLEQIEAGVRRHLARKEGAAGAGAKDKAFSTQLLKALRQVFMERHISREDMAVGASQADRALNHHLLLSDSWVMGLHVDKVWGYLSGTGSHYNGMFGTPDALRRGVGLIADKDVVRQLVGLEDGSADNVISRPPALTGERITLAVRILAAPSVSRNTPELAQIVRRHLSAELLAHPVLMHPRILMPASHISSGQLSFVCLSKALFNGHRLGLPRRSDFILPDRSRTDPVLPRSPSAGTALALDGLAPGWQELGTNSDQTVAKRPDGSLDDVELERLLLAFAKHPCVRESLATHSVDATHKHSTGHGPHFVFARRSLLKSTDALNRVAPQFLASVMELEERLVRADGGGSSNALPLPMTVLGVVRDVPEPESSDPTPDQVELLEVVQSTARGLLSCSGVLEIAAKSAPASMASPASRAGPHDGDYLASIRKRLPLLLKRSDFVEQLLNGFKRAVFMGRFDETIAQDIEFNTRRVARALVDSGVRPNETAAARLMQMFLIGRSRKDGVLPQVSLSEATAFIVCLKELGAFGSVLGPEHPDFEGSFEQLMPLAMGAVKDFPSHETPCRDVWLQAMEMVSTETRMRAVIETMSAPAPAPAAIRPAAVEAPVANDSSMSPRRRRAAV